MTQVVPPYYLTDLKTVVLYRRSLDKYMPTARPNWVSLEGFVDAMVVQGLKQAGKELEREGPVRAIESIDDENIGLGPQLKPDYSSKDHKGFDRVLPSVRSERAVPFTDRTIVTQK